MPESLYANRFLDADLKGLSLSQIVNALDSAYGSEAFHFPLNQLIENRDRSSQKLDEVTFSRLIFYLEGFRLRDLSEETISFILNILEMNLKNDVDLITINKVLRGIFCFREDVRFQEYIDRCFMLQNHETT